MPGGCGVEGLMQFEPGDHLWKKGGRMGGKLYDHHLIYKEHADGHVIIENSFRAGGVVQKTLAEDQLQKYSLYERPLEAAECLARAEAALAQGHRYNLLWYNCETFANECVRGGGGSMQVRRVSGHVALLSSVASAGMTATTIGLTAPKTVTATIPARGCGGVWAWLGYTQKVTKTKMVISSAGVATTAGALCGCLVWCSFAICGRDKRKRSG